MTTYKCSCDTVVLFNTSLNFKSQNIRAKFQYFNTSIFNIDTLLVCCLRWSLQLQIQFEMQVLIKQAAVLKAKLKKGFKWYKLIW